MIKVVNLISLLAAPLIVRYAEQRRLRNTSSPALLLIAVIWAILQSKKAPAELAANTLKG